MPHAPPRAPLPTEVGPEGFKDIAPYIVVLLMLMIKPSGLFGEKLRKKV